MRRNPVARLGAIKLKLGALLVGAVLLTIVVVLGGTSLGLPWWITALVALGGGLVAVDLLGSGLTSPLRQMARQADRLADGQPVDPVDDTANDEVGELARAFNRMAVEVAHTDRVRRELVANVSHELRTPLAALTAQVENLVDGVTAADPGELRRMEAQVRRLGHLVDDLLDLSQLDAGATALDRREVDLRRLAVDVAHAAGPVAASRVRVEIPADAASVEVDPDRFRQVLTNLVDNALRHGPGDEPVTVTAARRDGAVLVTVSDTGPGIAPEDAHRIFERFARSDEGRATATGGAGLGLAITRWIVELHGGSIRVDRPGEPGGRLTVELPVATSPPEPPVDGELPPPRPEDGATVAVATAAPPNSSPTPPAGDGLQLLPTPISGLGRRSLLAVAAAAVAAALTPLEGAAGIGFALVLLAGAAATVVAAERPLDRFAVACCGIAAVIAAQYAITDAYWALVPVTLGAVLLAGLGLWGPRRFGEVFRALFVGPVLTTVTPVALVRGVRSQRGMAVGRVLVPVLATLVVLLVFGGLLGDADAVFARFLDAMTPDIRLDETLVLRVLLAAGAAIVVTTYVLAQRAGTIETTPWARPVRPVLDWAAPLVALDLLLGAFVVVQFGALFGGDRRVQETVGLTYAEYARSGFGQLLVVALLTLGVVAVVARVADDSHRRLRDRLLGVLIGLTVVVLASSVLRLSLYTSEFGLSRLRVSAYAMLLWVGLVLALVVVAGTVHRFVPHLPRTVVVLTGTLAMVFVLAQPDALIARVNIARAEAGADLDLAYLGGLSADAVPVIIDELPSGTALDVIWSGGRLPTGDVPPDAVGCWPGPNASGTSWNLARWRARVAAQAYIDAC